MRLGGFLSFLLHLAILLLILFGLPDLFRQEEVMAPVAVQLATLADISGQPVPKPPTPTPVVKQDTPPPPPAPAPPTPPTPPAPTPPQPVEQPTPPPPPEPPPQPAPTAPQPAEQTPPEPVPIPDQQPTPPPPQEAKLEAPPPPLLRPPVPPDKPKPKPAQAQSFDSLLKNVEQMKTTAPDTQQPPQPDTQTQPDTSVSNLSAPQMTSSEKDAIASQVGNNWYLDAGKKGFEDFVIEIRATLAQDGTVLTAVIVDQARMATDANYRAAAEAARRAVLKASPLKVPPEKYETWKTMLLRFTPQGVIGL
jgi:hypothetical protein